MEVNRERGYAQVNPAANGGEDELKTEFKQTVDFPFDLNNLFSMQYSFDQLKMAIEYLAKQQGDHQSLINELLAREPSASHKDHLHMPGSSMGI